MSKILVFIDTSSERVEKSENYQHLLFRPDQAHNELPLLPPRGDVEKRRRVLAAPVSMDVRKTMSAERSWWPVTVGRCGRRKGQTMFYMFNASRSAGGLPTRSY